MAGLFFFSNLINFCLMFCICEFDPCCDIREVEQFGFVDLNASLESGTLPLSVPSSEQSFDAPNGTPLSPSQIFGVPLDVFDAMEMRDSVRAAIADANAKHEAASQSAAVASE